jgi:hypothetical protein
MTDTPKKRLVSEWGLPTADDLPAHPDADQWRTR